LRTIEIVTGDGKAQASLHGTPGAAAAGVILYMDAFGPRPALDEMASRLAGGGYVVLVPDLFYRFGAYGPFDAKTAFADEAKKATLTAMIGGTTQEMTMRDTAAFLAALDEAGATGPIGTVGYCMGGARAINAAAAHPERIRAAASFHGGRVGSDAPDSPVANAQRIKARVYVGAAGIDGSFPPEQAALFAQAFREAEVDYVLDNYVGMKHGWCVPDHGVYDPGGAERHWNRLATLFAETLAG
jgi:carboxymethylenebutenolidase